MRDRFPGYYRPTTEEFKELWEKALIVPDTNVLLALYRLTETTRGKLLEILERLQDRLFVPYQVGVEFQRNRLGVIEEQMRTYEEVEKVIDGFAASVRKDLRQHPRINREDLEKRIKEALAPVEEHLQELREGHPEPLESGDPIGADVIRDALEPLLAGRIGEERELESVVAEGRKRYERKQPPGWKDQEKPEPDRYGDLAIWLDVIAKADAEKLPVILVTEERKPDWWFSNGGETIGPQPALVAEMRKEAEQGFWLYSLERFMVEAAKVLDIEFSEDERDDAAQAGKATREHVIPRFLMQPQQWNIDPETLYSPPPGAAGTVVRPGELIPNGVRLSDYRVFGGSGVLGPGEDYGFVQHPSPGAIYRGWIASVETDRSNAVLRVKWHPEMIGGRTSAANRLICMVTDSQGNSTAASRRDTTLGAAFRYPDNFGGADEAGSGSYAYVWFYAGAEQEQPEEIARGEFELAAEEDQGAE